VWGSGGIAPTFLMSAPDGGDWSASCPGHYTPRESARSTHWIGGLDAVKQIKSLDPVGNRTPIIPPAASRYTDWAIRAPKWWVVYLQVLVLSRTIFWEWSDTTCCWHEFSTTCNTQQLEVLREATGGATQFITTDPVTLLEPGKWGA
jgi:hypothetical protein